ncbi:MAG TPA: hypothetical protein VFE31_12105 [Opitutaceae bacterium]|nr:hypothetical protein [Opitutaceae bacterium]
MPWICARRWGAAVAMAGLTFVPLRADPTLEQLAAENQSLRAQVQAQQKTIDALAARMDALERKTAPASDPAGASVSSAPAAPAPAEAPPPPAETAADSGAGAVHLSGEAGAAYFATGSDGEFPNGEFRIDEARLYLDAPVWGDVYFHGEIDPMTREAQDDSTHLGEVFAEVEDLPGGVNLRAGRFNIPFGEEYQFRNVMENSLISHSLADIWGFDEGVELYGSGGPWSYAAAVLDGSVNPLNRGHDGVSAAARVGFDPNANWGLILSAMTTGNVSARQDTISAVWFAGGFFVGLPGATDFHVTLVEADAHAAWRGGHVRAAAGVAAYADNGPAGDSRNLSYAYAEGVQPLFGSLYGAVRYSAIAAPKGYPLTGQGTAEDYLFGGVLTTHLERLSLGLGYRFADPLLLKVDFSQEWGRTIGEGDRDGENLFGTELGVKF